MNDMGASRTMEVEGRELAVDVRLCGVGESSGGEYGEREGL